MEIPDTKVFETMQEVARMHPTLNRLSKFIDNGDLDQRITNAINSHIDSCNAAQTIKTHKAIHGVFKWIITLLIPTATALLVVFISLGFGGK